MGPERFRMSHPGPHQRASLAQLPQRALAGSHSLRESDNQEEKVVQKDEGGKGERDDCAPLLSQRERIGEETRRLN